MNLHSKKDFQDCMLSILNPLKPYYSEEKARLTLGVTMAHYDICLLYTSPSPRDMRRSRMPSSA